MSGNAGRVLRVAVIGGGIAGVTAAWQLVRLSRESGRELSVTLFEQTARLGGTVETVYREGFTIECGPDGWVTEKPWARELAIELGLGEELIGSNNAERATHILLDGVLREMPRSMRMMVPTDLEELRASALFSESAKEAYAAEVSRAEELRRAAPDHDESIAAFVERHFGAEVLTKIAAPLLSGVFGGDVAQLSVRAVMPAFVQMEREHGSLIAALQARGMRAGASTVFTSLKQGTGALVDAMVREIPAAWLRMNTRVVSLRRAAQGWAVSTDGEASLFDEVMLAVPADAARTLLAPTSARLAELLRMDASSAVLVALAFDHDFALPRGFGFLVAGGERCELMATTFVDQKYAHRVPPGSRLLRAFFGGETAARLEAENNAEIAATALRELQRILGPLPAPRFHVVRRWPRSLPQYEVGHLERVAEMEELAAAEPGLHLLGNSYHGVGLPDLVRDARLAARAAFNR